MASPIIIFFDDDTQRNIKAAQIHDVVSSVSYMNVDGVDFVFVYRVPLEVARLFRKRVTDS